MCELIWWNGFWKWDLFPFSFKLPKFKRLNTKQLLLTFRPGLDPKLMENGEEEKEGKILLAWYRFMYRMFFQWHFALLGQFSSEICQNVNIWVYLNFKESIPMVDAAKPFNDLTQGIVNGVPVLCILPIFMRQPNCLLMELVANIFIFQG
jgi:hypothetical protein